MLSLRYKFYASTFEGHRKIAYTMQGQLQSLPERQKKFITLSNCKVCENIWYIIHNDSRSAYHKYKAAALGGWVNKMHRNAKIARPQAHTIQAKANFMAIIQDNTDHMPNEFGNIGKKRVNNLFILLVALNWDHMRDISNLESHSFYLNVIVLTLLISWLLACDGKYRECYVDGLPIWLLIRLLDHFSLCSKVPDVT